MRHTIARLRYDMKAVAGQPFWLIPSGYSNLCWGGNGTSVEGLSYSIADCC
jgi:hypothetical protein